MCELRDESKTEGILVAGVTIVQTKSRKDEGRSLKQTLNTSLQTSDFRPQLFQRVR